MDILIVDGNEVAAADLRTALEQDGHHVEVMLSGFGVLDRVAGRAGQLSAVATAQMDSGEGVPPPEVVIVEQALPGVLNGGKLLSLMANDVAARDVPAILFTGARNQARAAAQGGLKAHPRSVWVPKGNLEKLKEALSAVNSWREV